jgi:hypothetical protein
MDQSIRVVGILGLEEKYGGSIFECLESQVYSGEYGLMAGSSPATGSGRDVRPKQGCCNYATRVLQGCYEGITRVLRGRYADVTRPQWAELQT